MNTILFTFILIFCRISSFMVTAPGFSFKQTPSLLKILISFSLSISVFSVLPETISTNNLYIGIFYIIKELLVGIALGFVVQLIFSAIEMAGQIIDFQVGFSMGSVYDQTIGIQGSNYGRLYYWLALTLFFVTDMHHIVIENLLASFDIVPLTEASMKWNTVEGMVKLFAKVFEMSIMLAAPVVLVAFVTDCVLGIVSRSVPQINVLMLGMPMKILISFFFVLLFLPNLVQLIIHIFPDMNKYMSEFLQSLGR
ncbi:flagellar biosynthetic protein FliR [Vagococcus hydrophili]|uniref:Flagellar biosynthetic protein FliR n=1 Tax=Vagococcus hydrophili TaxID=2714947 RepID=A0A6G8AWI3_9ENTE|nr:flagellar biosynthetic protein FliR [Vagococcus hydrophili]QIL49340.1 flagellar biosynthetic protein FliR [Vagococcus hydrophili]